MKILIVAATDLEISPLTKKLPSYCHTLITGIGVAQTTYHLTKKIISQNYDLVINAGIAGTFNIKHQLGETFFITHEQFADIGIQSEDSFQTIFEARLQPPNIRPFKNSILINPYSSELNITNLPRAKAITVNTTSGNRLTIKQRQQKFGQNIETMEGAAVFYVCLNENIKFVEIRTISNYVEPRNKKAWKIKTAIDNLNVQLIKYIDTINVYKETP